MNAQCAYWMISVYLSGETLGTALGSAITATIARTIILPGYFRLSFVHDASVPIGGKPKETHPCNRSHKCEDKFAMRYLPLITDFYSYRSILLILSFTLTRLACLGTWKSFECYSLLIFSWDAMICSNKSLISW